MEEDGIFPIMGMWDNEFKASAIQWKVQSEPYLYCRQKKIGEITYMHMRLKQIPLQLMSNRTTKTVETIADCLQKCISMRSLKQVHACIITSGLHQKNYLLVKLVSLTSKVLGDIAYARTIFDGSRDIVNVFLWTAMITAYCRHHSVEAILIYREMCRLHSIAPNSFTLSSVLKACSILLAVQQGYQLHVHAVKLGLNSDIYVQTTLMDMYAKFGCIESAKHLFNTMSERSVVACNAMIVCYTKSGNVKAARAIFDKMAERDSISWASMICGYTNHGSMPDAQKLFDQMSERDVTSWNALITGYSHSGEWLRALHLFNQMQSDKVKPNQVTIAVVISVCGHIGALEMAKEIHEYLQKDISVEKNAHVFNSLIDMYAKCGSVDEAHRVFSEMPFKDIVSYNAMIVGFANHGHGEDALKLFSNLLLGGLQPDGVTFLGVLTACSHSGLLDLGRQYFSSMTRDHRIEPSVDHYACMVDLLGRAGLVDEAYELVKTMAVEPHAGVWGALLGACRTYCNVEVGEIAAGKLFRMEPGNPGNYILLSNIYARANMWDGVAKVRRWMSGRGVTQTAGCSWIDVDSGAHNFLIGRASTEQFTFTSLLMPCESINSAYENLSVEFELDVMVMTVTQNSCLLKNWLHSKHPAKTTRFNQRISFAITSLNLAVKFEPSLVGGRWNKRTHCWHATDFCDLSRADLANSGPRHRVRKSKLVQMTGPTESRHSCLAPRQGGGMSKLNNLVLKEV
ncbi:hypothetical protein HHK36_012860 [Tetracentron sinense]|uniref:Pentatricopeptide repeat-containing protein n=1 Tax=Tetracentron sinense TaxID=13715 RepID=A0A834Z9N8_TETSI|nr:hypothetical protein HHK36_012860 [Tetracentron sinense]